MTTRTTARLRPFRPSVEALEDRTVLSTASQVAVLSQIASPLQQAVQRMMQFQAQLSSDLATMKKDADNLTFFTESMAQQTTNDADYARLGSDVAQVAALDAQVHNEAALAFQVIALDGASGKHAPKGLRAVTQLARQLVTQTQATADQIKAAMYGGAPVTQSPIAGQPLAPQYPAFNTILGFPG
jgi:hypothetical protein